MNHLTLADFSPDNYQSYVEKPDPSFSRQRNYQIIEAVLAENDKMQRELKDEVKKAAGDVADILTSFAKYKLDIGGEKQLEEWIGREWMKKIYGDKLLEKIRMAEVIREQNRKRGNTKFENFYLT